MGALFGVVLSSPVWAQRRGGGYAGGASHGGAGFSGSAARGGFAGRGPVNSNRSFGSGNLGARNFGSSGSSRFGAHFGTGFRQPFIYSNRFYRRGFYGSYWPYAYAGGYYIDPGFYNDYDYPAPDTNYPGGRCARIRHLRQFFQSRCPISAKPDRPPRGRSCQVARAASRCRQRPARVPVSARYSSRLRRQALGGSTELRDRWRDPLDFQRGPRAQACHGRPRHSRHPKSQRRSRRGFPPAAVVVRLFVSTCRHPRLKTSKNCG